jgi:hypothetical protein
MPKPIFSVLFRLRLRSVRRSLPPRRAALRYSELVSPVLHFMRLKKADSASVLWTRAGEIRHPFASDLKINAVASWQVPGIVRICAPWPAAGGRPLALANSSFEQVARPPVYRLIGMHVRSAAVVTSPRGRPEGRRILHRERESEDPTLPLKGLGVIMLS